MSLLAPAGNCGLSFWLLDTPCSTQSDAVLFGVQSSRNLEVKGQAQEWQHMLRLHKLQQIWQAIKVPFSRLLCINGGQHMHGHGDNWLLLQVPSSWGPSQLCP